MRVVGRSLRLVGRSLRRLGCILELLVIRIFVGGRPGRIGYCLQAIGNALKRIGISLRGSRRVLRLIGCDAGRFVGRDATDVRIRTGVLERRRRGVSGVQATNSGRKRSMKF